jgi:hypothetical protein
VTITFSNVNSKGPLTTRKIARNEEATVVVELTTLVDDAGVSVPALQPLAMRPTTAREPTVRDISFNTHGTVATISH